MAERDNDVATLRQHLRAFGNSGRIYPAMNGVIQSVNESNYTCQVLLDDGSEITAALTCGDKAEGIVQIPKQGSDVVVVCFDKINSVVVMCDQIEKIIINGGTLGGLVKVKELKKNLNKITARIDGIIGALKDAVPLANDGGNQYKTQIVASLNTLTDKEDFETIENERIKQ
ncbi:MAG: hypothetical protein LBR17_08435 [Bacteroidales bacterium]|jgi:hypothetical protein|nr:hypothetical protein [Bacteroidales bacterium]